MSTYWDIITPKFRDERKPRNKQKQAPRKAWEDWELSKLDASRLVLELWNRGVSFERIFGLYYELDAIEDAKVLTVGDALLVTPATTAKTPLGEAPF